MEISSWSGQGYEPGRASTLLSGAESGLLGTLDEDDAGSQASDGRDEEARHTHPSDQDQGAASAGAGAAAAAPRSYYQVRFVGEGQGERNPRHSMWSTYFVNRIFISRALWMSLRARAMRVSLPPERRSIYGLRILPPFHWACMAWASFMLLFDLIYTAFWVPLAVGLCTAASEVTIDGVCAQGNLFGGIIYTLNLVLSFQLGVVLEYDAQQVAVADGPTVVWAYVRFGRFVIDVISIVPFVYLIVSIAGENSAESFLNVISLVRLIRLVRILSIAKRVYLNASGSIKMQGTGINIYVGTLVYLMMVLLNLEACVLLLVASWEGLDNSWMTSLTWIDLPNASPAHHWYSAIYFVITTATTTGNGDVVPKTIAELVICNIIMIGGMLMIGIVVGTVSQFMTRASGNAAEIHSMSKKISSVDEWLDKHGVGKETKRRVKNFFSQDHPPPGDGVEVFKDVPHSYRHTLASHLMVGTVSSLKLFKCQELGLRQLVAQYLRPVDIAPGCDLCHQGTEGDCLWVLTEGSLQALQYMCAPLTVTAPSLVGDSLLLRDDVPAFGARCFTIRSFKAATQRVVAWELPLVNLAPILRMYPSLRTDTLEHVRNRTLVQLASGGDNRNSWRPTAGTIGGSTLTDWCESVTSITRTLLNQSQDLVDTTMEELRKARTQDASLQHLLDTLLDFSISNVHQKGNSTLDRVSSIGSATRGEYDFGTGAVRRVLSNQRRLSISRESLHQLSIPRGSQPSAPDPGAHAGGGGGGGGGRAGRGGGGGVEEDVGERVGGGGRGDHGLATNSTGGSHTAHRAPRPHGRGSALGSASVGLAGGGPEGPQSSSLGGGGRRALLAPPYLKKLSTVKEQEAKGAKQVQGAPSKGSEAQQQADAGASNREGGMAAQGGGGDSERAGIVAGLQPEARGDGMVASPFLSDAVAAGRAAASGAGAAAGRAAASGAGTASGASTVTSTDRLPAALTGAAPPLLLRIAPPLLLHPADPASPPASSERLPRVSVLNALNAASDSLTRVPHPSSPRASFGSHRSVSLSSPRRHSIGSPGGLSPLASRGRVSALGMLLRGPVSDADPRPPGSPHARSQSRSFTNLPVPAGVAGAHASRSGTPPRAKTTPGSPRLPRAPGELATLFSSRSGTPPRAETAPGSPRLPRAPGELASLFSSLPGGSRRASTIATGAPGSPRLPRAPGELATLFSSLPGGSPRASAASPRRASAAPATGSVPLPTVGPLPPPPMPPSERPTPSTAAAAAAGGSGAEGWGGGGGGRGASPPAPRCGGGCAGCATCDVPNCPACGAVLPVPGQAQATPSHRPLPALLSEPTGQLGLWRPSRIGRQSVRPGREELMRNTLGREFGGDDIVPKRAEVGSGYTHFGGEV